MDWMEYIAKHLTAVAVLLWALWIVIAVVVARVIIPGLVNLHNDGALILAIMLGFGIPISGYLLHTFVRFLKQEMVE